MHALPDGWTPGGPLNAGTLKTEYTERPLGTDVRRPRLAWIATGPGYGATQTAYQVLVASSPELLTPESADVWDSGKVTSARTFGIEYDGQALTPRTRYHWTVRLWDGLDREGGWAEPEWFETGLLDEGWGTARWIGGTTDSAPLLRRAFTTDGTVKQARLYASGLGYADLRLNGQRISDAVLDPGFTDYDHTVLYVTHDVTDLLRSGDNVVGAELGRGFFGLTTPNAWRWHQAPWTAEPRLLARLVIEYDDGRTTEVGSDESWRITGGPTTSRTTSTPARRTTPDAPSPAGTRQASTTRPGRQPPPSTHRRARSRPRRTSRSASSRRSNRQTSPRSGPASGSSTSAAPRPAGRSSP